MSVHVSSWVWRHSTAKGSPLLVLLAIADHAHDDGGSAYPSVVALAEKCRMNRSTVMRAVAELESLGEVEVVRARGAVSRYRVVMDGSTASTQLVAIPDRSQSATGGSGAQNRSQLASNRSQSATRNRQNRQNRQTGRRKRTTALPDDWQPTDQHRTAAAELGVDVDTEAAKFRDHAAASDRRLVDWDAAFRNWMRNAAAWSRRDSPVEPEQPAALTRNTRRRSGMACPTCVDSGWVEVDGMAVRCDHGEGAAS